MTRQELETTNFLRIYFYAKDFWDFFIDNINVETNIICVTNIHNGETSEYSWWENKNGQIIINSPKWFCIIISNEESINFIEMMHHCYARLVDDARKNLERQQEFEKKFAELKKRAQKKTSLNPTWKSV